MVLGEITDGWKYIYSNPSIRRIVFAKGLWASGGGAQVFLLILIGMEAGFGEVAAGVGILFMARGFGSGFGPLAGRHLMENNALRPYLIGVSVGVCGAFYIAVSMLEEWTEIVLLLVFLSHAASGLNWVLSVSYTHLRAHET